MMKGFIKILIFLTCQITIITAQTLNAYEKAADEAFEKADYYNALYYYEQVLKTRQKPSIYFKYAEACRYSYAYNKAEEAYKKVIESEEKDRYDKLEFYFALTLKHNAKYSEAAIYFKKFANNRKTNDYYKQKALQELNSCFLADALVKNPSDSIKIERLGDNINTEYSDFAAHYTGKGNSIMYSSLRFDRKIPEGEKRDAKRLVSKLITVDSISSKSNTNNTLNSESEHSANSCISSDGNRLYYTKCSAANNDSISCKIYLSRKDANGLWLQGVELGSPLNQGSFTYTQPHLTVIDGIEWLFFVSDMPGSFGLEDIWMAKMISDSAVDKPINLGNVINSPDKEASPFFHNATKRLYFSSQWHLGLGGFDIFYSEKRDTNWLEPVNAGVPLNSAANDYYWYLGPDDSTGFFASNRSGSMTITEESCCNDIYKFTFDKKLSPVIDSPSVSSVPTDSSELSFTESDFLDMITEVIPEKSDLPELTIDFLNEMLPIKLYFHNDEPDSNVTRFYTYRPYEEPYSYYISLQPTYVREYSSQFTGEKRVEAEQKINDFFENSVKSEFARLNEFLDNLNELLQNGEKIELQIKGFTSPRSYNYYNFALGHRRIWSLKNQIFKHNSSILKPYLNSGQLTIKELSFGETKSPNGISDAFNDPKNSIFSVEASKERRVEIVLLKKH